MGDSQSVSDGPGDGDAPGVNFAAVAPPPAASLLGLPTSLLDDILRRALQHGAGEALSLSCRALSETRLLHAPSFRIKLDNRQCDQLLTPRITAALRARTDKLTLILEEPAKSSGKGLLCQVLARLGCCPAVESCRLGNNEFIWSLRPLDCTPCLTQHLVDSFPSLNALSLHGYSITCSGLASLLAHPQLCVQLQQLDLTRTTITQQPDQPGAVTLDDLFHGARLKRLSLDVDSLSSVPNMDPLAQHLTHLRVSDGRTYTRSVEPRVWLADRVPQLLQLLPLLRTLLLPDVIIKGHQEPDALLAATQLTSVQLRGVQGLDHGYSDSPCSWQRLELTGQIEVATAAYLPLHTLTQPPVLGCLDIIHIDSSLLLAAAAHNLTQGGKLLPRFRALNLRLWEEAMTLEQTAALLQPLHDCCWGTVSFKKLEDVSSEHVPAMAALCRGCTHLEFFGGSLGPSLEFWHQLVQLMPSVQHVAFTSTEGLASAAMCECLHLMAEQPWARWLDITITPPFHALFQPLPKCCLDMNNTFNNPSTPGKFRVRFKARSDL
ncbi:hypothetical protein QJQ45_008977 [Haematococcus lacustris]|nr:hypothetical protein QJQ45_013570 [Haematococcus lacustris]KAJ9521638.1 hypothetical protein QJQ45_008977 [Haematococcus lacustris]